jgi:hypothetical protein
MTTVGSLVYQFFELHLKAEKGPLPGIDPKLPRRDPALPSIHG